MSNRSICLGPYCGCPNESPPKLCDLCPGQAVLPNPTVLDNFSGNCLEYEWLFLNNPLNFGNDLTALEQECARAEADLSASCCTNTTSGTTNANNTDTPTVAPTLLNQTQATVAPTAIPTLSPINVSTITQAPTMFPSAKNQTQATMPPTATPDTATLSPSMTPTSAPISSDTATPLTVFVVPLLCILLGLLLVVDPLLL